MACCALLVAVLLKLLAYAGYRHKRSATLSCGDDETCSQAAWAITSARALIQAHWSTALAMTLLVAGLGGLYLSTSAPGTLTTAQEQHWDELVALHTTWCRTAESVTGIGFTSQD